MVRVSGPLVNVTTSASSVRDVQVHTKKVRAWGDGLMTPDPSQAKLSNGVVEFEAAPGPVVMVLFLVEAGAETVSLVVGEGATQSLADAYRDGQMASDRDAGELAGILEQIRESVGASAEARAGAEAAAVDAAGSAVSAGRDAARAEAAAGEAATEAAGLAAAAVRLEVREDADRSAAGATTATEKAAEAAGSATRAEEAEAGAVEAEEGAEAGQELSEDAAAVAVAATAAFEGHSPQQVIDAADRAEAASERVGTVAQIETWVGDVQEAADRVGTAEQVETWAGQAQDDAEKAEGHATTATTAAGEATEAASEAQGIATNLPATIASELDTRVPPKVAAELDTRVPSKVAAELGVQVPPAVADAIASDRAVADAAAAAVADAVEDVMLDAGPLNLSGTGFPEGKVSAPVGSIYTDTAATAGAIRWIKTAGTGATGWQVEYGSTGWRNLRSAISPAPTSGVFNVIRNTTSVTLHFDALPVNGINNFTQFPFLLPAGFRPLATVHMSASPIGSGDVVGPIRVQSNGTVTIYGVAGKHQVIGLVAFPAEKTWPASTPGTPV